jgi:adenosylcobinamide-GDP ribazoletransferase
LLAFELWLLQLLHFPPAVRSTGVILTGLWLTGGLHFDGAMDTADGLAVQDKHRRLQVMADSRSGAFGVMVAIAILLLKVTALTALVPAPWYALVAAASWGRWGQQWAIACYPYLKPDGKGAFHKRALRSSWDTLPSALLLLGLNGVLWSLGAVTWQTLLTATLLGIISAITLAHWLNHKLGGHTGDTYGAVVEWVEVMILVGLSAH